MTDRDLVKEVINGDSNAFKELVERYTSLVVNTCYGFTHNKEDAEDIAQDVFIKVYQIINKFRNESKISTWLYRISVNRSLNFIRNNKKYREQKSIESNEQSCDDVLVQVVDDDQNNPETKIENKERANILHQAIDSLAKNQRIAFTLSKYEDMSYAQIAEVMAVSISSVESLLHRAKKNLQKKLIDFYRKDN